MNAILDDIKVEDLPSKALQEVADVIGISMLKELIVKCPGTKLYIPKSVKTITNRKYCQDNFTGDNHAELAKHLDITKRSVYRLLKNPVDSDS